MSNTVIPKERLTPYQRWELPAFDAVQAEAPPPVPAQPPPTPEPVIVLPTAAEIEQMQSQAREEGYAEGIQAANADVKSIALMLQNMSQELQKIDREISQELLNLALEVARQMVHEALSVHPELLLNVVRDAIASLPHFNQGAHIALNPSDAELLRGLMGEQLSHSGWKIFEDAKIERGGFRIETAHSQIDATLETRWKNIVSGIGQNPEWLRS